MAADYNKPVTTDNYADLLTQLRENIAAAQTMLNDLTGVTNIPTDAVRYDQTLNKFQSYNGSTFDDLVLSPAGGGTGVTALGTAAYVNTGTGASDIPLNSDLSEAAVRGSYVGYQYLNPLQLDSVALSGFTGLDLKSASFYRKTLGGGSTASGAHIMSVGASGQVNIYSLATPYDTTTISATPIGSESVSASLGGESVAAAHAVTNSGVAYLYILTSGYKVLKFEGLAAGTPGFSLEETHTLSATYTPSGTPKGIHYDLSTRKIFITGENEIIQATLSGGTDSSSIDGTYSSKSSKSISGIDCIDFTLGGTFDYFDIMVSGQVSRYVIPSGVSAATAIITGSTLTEASDILVHPDGFCVNLFITSGNTLSPYETTRISYFTE